LYHFNPLNCSMANVSALFNIPEHSTKISLVHL